MYITVKKNGVLMVKYALKNKTITCIRDGRMTWRKFETRKIALKMYFWLCKEAGWRLDPTSEILN